ncbi:unnamed protein product [Blepharisma stoltei]|uniref:Transmembrane protein 164 n=1 Tax=Blepharisma stoltei TaxID=1481888 RepID=A0AAU9KDI8_9CILI|nr:unnamed protein product [Blepharisma stoltei]
MNAIRDIFLAGAYTLDATFIEDGGPHCVAQLTNFYRLSVSGISFTVHLLIYLYFSRPYIIKSQVPRKPQSPYLIEKILGLCHILIIIWQLITKSITGRLIFILSPCHLVTLAQCYLLFVTSSLKSERHFTKIISLSWAPAIAIFLPAAGNLTLPGEYALFWIQHYLAGLITPLTLIICGRFTRSYQLNWKSLLYGFHFFWFYQRLVTPLAILTWANIDFSLCGSPSDFIFAKIGKLYYVAAELYLFSLPFIFTLVYLNIGKLIRPSLFKIEDKKE